MNVLEVATGKKYEIDVLPLESGDYQRLIKSRYFFEWSTEQNYEVYKVQVEKSSDIIGLISLENIPYEWRFHIRLLTVSKENKGKAKRFEGIAVNLLAFAAKLAVKEYVELACISLRPKSKIAQHYIDNYGMSVTGNTLSLMVPEILDLINTYDHE